MRHSIRADKKLHNLFGKTEVTSKIDPPITENGKELALKTGMLI